MNLYIVESPLQLLCAYEAIKLDNKRYELYVRMTGRGCNDQHLLTCVEKLNLHYKLITLRTNNLVCDFFKNLLFFIKIFLKKYDVIYFGSYYSSFLKVIRKISRQKKIFYLDDGAATLRAQSQIQNNVSTKVNWFTFFELNTVKGQEVIKHNFENLKNHFQKYNKKGNYFIGQPVEIMMGFEKEDYIRCVSVIAKNINDSQSLKYIPHRVENVDYIENIPNIEILRLDLPVEMYFLTNVNYPCKIYSCYSTALVSLKSIFKDLEVVSIKNKNNKKNIEELDIVYRYLEDNHIKQISL